MVILAMCLLVGVVLGFRFKVFVLIPAIAALSFLMAISGAIAGHTLWQIAISIVLFAALLQVGYLCGVLLRFSPFGRRYSATRSNQLPDGPMEHHPPFRQVR
jgi:hypothetical protein